MSSSKKLPVKGLCGRCLSVWGPPFLWTHTPLTHCTRVYRKLIHKGKGESYPERRLKEQQFTKLGRKYHHDQLFLQSTNSDNPLPQSPFTVKFFRWRHFALVWFGYLVSGSDVQELITKMARLLSEGLEDRGRSPATLTRYAENIFNCFFCKNILSLLLNFY